MTRQCQCLVCRIDIGSSEAQSELPRCVGMLEEGIYSQRPMLRLTVVGNVVPLAKSQHILVHFPNSFSLLCRKVTF